MTDRKNKNAVREPNFFIVGAAKCGTTSLYYYLKQHPEIYLPRKESFFLISDIYKNINTADPAHRKKDDIIYTIEDYLKLYCDAGNKKAIGEVGTGYMYYHDIAIPRIKRYLGDVKILMVLRNPIDRAYSSYRHFVTMNVPGLSTFEGELKMEEERVRNRWDFMWFHVRLGFYYEQVKAYIENFSKVKVYLFDDLETSPADMIKDMYGFLEVDTGFVPVLEKYNISGTPRSKMLQNFIFQDNPVRAFLRPIVKMVVPKEKRSEMRLWVVKKNLKKGMDMRPETRSRLREMYSKDITMLQGLIGRDLSTWLKG